MRLACVLAVTLTVAPSLAHADDVNAAKQHFQRGTALYDLQRYDEAAAEYEKAFEAKNDPAFLFNIGQAYRFAKQYEKAIRSFKAFLRRMPETPMRPQIEKWNAEMQTSLDAQAANDTHPAHAPKPLQPAPAPETPQPSTATPAPAPTATSTGVDEGQRRAGRIKTIVGFAAAGVGVAALGTGIAFAFVARGPYNELNSPSSGYVFNPSTQDALHRDQALEVSLITVGSVLVVGGVAVGLWGLHQERAARATTVAEVR